MKTTKLALGLYSLLIPLLLNSCATPQAPALTKITIDKTKDQVFDAALLTLQEWGEDILAVDRSGGVLVTKPREWGVGEDLVLNYRMTIFVKKMSDGSSEFRIKLNGYKYMPSTGASFGVDETDHDVRGIIEGITWGTQSKIDE